MRIYNNADFAAVTATGSAIYGGRLDQLHHGDLGSLASSGTVNAQPSGDAEFLSAARTINSLNLTGTTGVTMTGTGALALDSGGLIGNTTGSISGGTLEGLRQRRTDDQYVQNFSIGSVIADNGGPTALVKTGTGTLTLTGGNTFTGDTYLNQGTLVYAPTSNLTYGGAISGIGGLTKSGSAHADPHWQRTPIAARRPSARERLPSTAQLGGGKCGDGPKRRRAGGSGTIGGSVLLSGGTIDLSNGGTISGSVTANGGFWQGAGSVAGAVTVPSGTFTIGNTNGTGSFTANGGLNVTGTGCIGLRHVRRRRWPPASITPAAPARRSRTPSPAAATASR